MAIQLNDRDQLIFKLIDEHEVLLEKHISWFIAGDEKPVLIRDRLRKLFYLDYLLCHRHGSKLPWWTTPTKPLVYVLSSMARKLNGFGENQDDVLDNEFQRHHLEVANLRMLFLVAQKNGLIKDFNWQTCKRERQTDTGLNAKITFQCQNAEVKIGVVNNPQTQTAHIEKLTKSLVSEDLNWLLVIGRDETELNALKTAMKEQSTLAGKVLFSTHQDLYRDGVMNASWQTVGNEQFDLAAGKVVVTPISPIQMANYTNPPIAV